MPFSGARCACAGAATPAQQQVLSLLSDDEDTPAPRRYTHHPESDEDEVMCLPASNPAAQPNVRQNHATQIDPSSQCSVDTSSRTPTFDLSSPPRSRFAAAAQDVETPPKAPGGFEPLARGAGGGAAGGSRTEAARQQAPDSNVALLVDMGFDAGLAAKVCIASLRLAHAYDMLLTLRSCKPLTAVPLEHKTQHCCPSQGKNCLPCGCSAQLLCSASGPN